MLNGINVLNAKQNISSLKFSNSFHPLNFKGNTDRFEKTEREEDNYKNFENWAKRTNFLQNMQNILNNEENKIGEGFSHVAYEVPENDKYVIRFVKCQNEFNKTEEIPLENFKIKDAEDKNLKGNFGQSIAYIYNPHSLKGFEILKKQQGKSLGVPPPEAIYEENGNLKTGRIPLEDKQNKKQYENSLDVIATFPVSSYEKLIENILEAQEAGYAFDDENPNNFLYDEKNQAINIIDLDQRGTIFKNELGNNLCALCGEKYLHTYISDKELSDEKKNKTVGNFLTIIDKFTQAMKNKGVKFDPNNLKFYNFVTSFIFSFFVKTDKNDEKWKKLDEMGLIDNYKLD